MKKGKMLGLIVRQAREEKNWTQQELADKMGIPVDKVTELENGNADPSMTEAAGYFFLLNISPDITMYEDNKEDVLRMNRLFRELQTLTPDQFDRVCRSASHIRQWRENHPNVITLDDYQNAIKNEAADK